MLIKESHVDVETEVGGKGSMRIFIFHPSIPGYSTAKFPGVVLFSEIYQVTGPVARFARLLAGHGYIVAAPSSYHNYTGPEPLAYDVPGTDQGNAWKASKPLSSYDEDATLAVDTLFALPTCTGKVGTTGMCLGGHLAYRCAMDRRVSAAVCYFATDIHTSTLGSHSTTTISSSPSIDDDDDTDPAAATSLSRTTAGHLRHAELAMIFGKQDTHVPAAGRDVIRAALHASGTEFSWYEPAGAQHAFIRDELSKGRYDPGIAGVCWGMLEELFGRRLKVDLGAADLAKEAVEHVC